MRKLLYLLALLIGVIYAYYKPMDKVADRLTVSQVHAQRMAEIEQEQVENIPSTETVIAEITRVFMPSGKEAVRWAINCFYSESKWRYNALNYNNNKTYDAGVAQINDVHGMSIGDRMDYKKNIQKAYEIYLNSGVYPWYGSLCR